jgi:cell division protein FtsL
MVRKKIGKSTILALALGGLAAILILTFYLWHLTEDVRLGYAITGAQTQRKDLNTAIQKLKTKRATLLSLDRVESTARRDLKLADPREDQIVYENR